ncbi:MAG: hypothetical protein HYZ35_05830 [Chloroflexi bacterium]|nr:hypothetical protein [Chloroflexota bacterium]
MNNTLEPGRVSRSEWRWAWGWALAVVALSCAPYVYAALAAPPGHTFGGFLINTQDGNSYLAKMRQGYDGAWLFRLPFTPEDQRGIFVFTLYLGLGHLARLTGLPLLLVFHLARAAAGLFLLLTVYRLAAELSPDIAARRWAFAIVAFGGGLALVSIVIGRSNAAAFVPVDLFVPESVGFYSILSNPHFSPAFALQAWAIVWLLHPPRLPLWAQCLGMCLIGVGIISLAPYLAPVVAASAVAALFIQRPYEPSRTARLFALGAGMAALLAYDVWTMRSDPAVIAWAAQNITASPPPADTLLGLGLWFPLAVVGLWRVGTFGKRPALAVAVWLGVGGALVYIPYALQRRFLGGLFIPMAVPAGAGVAWLLSQMAKRWERALSLAVLLLFGFTSNALVLAALLRAPASADPALYLTNDEVAALRWIDAHTTAVDVVLADARLGNAVPGWAGARVVYGHPMETIDAVRRRAEVDAYFDGGGDLPDRYRVAYILGGPVTAGWQVVFQSGAVRVYGR